MEIIGQFCKVGSSFPLLPDFQDLNKSQQTYKDSTQTSCVIVPSPSLKRKKKKLPYLNHKILKGKLCLWFLKTI